MAADASTEITELTVDDHACLTFGETEELFDLTAAFVRDGLVRPIFHVEEHISRLAELASRYADRKPDLADLCVIRLSELYPKHPVITVDTDFRIYRRGRREAIPLIHPWAG